MKSVTDVIRQFARARFAPRMSPIEAALAVHLRGNDALHDALTTYLYARIAGRASVAEPTDPLACKSMVARDREVQAIVAGIDYLFHSPANTATSEENGEQPEE